MALTYRGLRGRLADLDEGVAEPELGESPPQPWIEQCLTRTGKMLQEEVVHPERLLTEFDQLRAEYLLPSWEHSLP
jgi:hypothetical protein